MTDQPTPPDIEVTDNIPGGLKVTTQTPYRVLVTGSFGGSSDAGAIAGALADGPVEINAESFDKVMADARPSIGLKTIDPIAAGNAMVHLDLCFDSMRSFDPKQIVQQIPRTKNLMAARDIIVERLTGKIKTEKLADGLGRLVEQDSSLSWIMDATKWTPGAAPADPGQVDALLGQIDLGDGSEESSGPPPKSPIGAMVSAAASDGTSIPAEEASALRKTMGEIDRRLCAWLTTVLHAPEVQSIEAAWRSLAFLVTQTDFRKGLKLSILHSPDGELLERFRTQLIDPVFDKGVPAPDVIVVNRQFGNTAADMESLDEFAQHAASLPAVVLAGVSSGFFGVKHAWQMATLPTIGNLFDQWQFAKWKSLRNEPYARSLGAVFGRCLLRAPYQRGDTADMEFAYREEAIGEKDFVWAGGAIAAATAIVRSVADIGWPTAMAGFVHGRVEGFAKAMGGKKGDKQFGPTDVMLPQPKIEEMATVGLSAAVGIRDHDDAIIWNGLTAAQPHRVDPDALFEVSLPYRLFASRLSVLLFELKPHLAGLSADQVKSTVSTHVRDWLSMKEDVGTDELSVQTRPAEDAPSTMELAVTLTPPKEILPGAVPVVMGYRLN